MPTSHRRDGARLRDVTPEDLKRVADFRADTVRRLREIGNALSDWLEEWIELENHTSSGVNADACTGDEYPFEQSLDELVACVYTAAERIEERDGYPYEAKHVGYPVRLAHTKREVQTLLEGVHPQPKEHKVWPGYHVPEPNPPFDFYSAHGGSTQGLSALRQNVQHALRVVDEEHARSRQQQQPTPYAVALDVFRRMVTAFAGGYHPDTDPGMYAGYPDGYNADRVDDIEAFARSCGIDLYDVALQVTQEALRS